MTIASYDHTAVPIRDVNHMLVFYERLGFSIEPFNVDAYEFWAVQSGDVKINFHAPATWAAGGFDLRAPKALPGSADFCFVWDGTLATLTSFLLGLGIDILTGPVERIGGRSNGKASGQSIYIRDPDQNLLEFIVYDTSDAKESAE